MRIPARNEVAIAKGKARPTYEQWHTLRLEADRIAYWAKRYRDGFITAEDLAPADRNAVCVWLLNHKRAIV